MGPGNPAGRPTYTHIKSYRTLIPMDKTIEVLGGGIQGQDLP